MEINLTFPIIGILSKVRTLLAAEAGWARGKTVNHPEPDTKKSGLPIYGRTLNQAIQRATQEFYQELLARVDDVSGGKASVLDWTINSTVARVQNALELTLEDQLGMRWSTLDWFLGRNTVGALIERFNAAETTTQETVVRLIDVTIGAQRWPQHLTTSPSSSSATVHA